MIVIGQYNDKLMKTYSDSEFKIRPIYDRLGKEISPHAKYDIAVDIIVEGKPRYDYVETDEKITKHEDEMAQES